MEETSQSQLFLSKIKNMYDKKMANSIMMDRVEYNSKLSRLLELANDHHSKKHPNDFRLLKAYDVLVCEGSTVPKLCKRDTNMPYVPIEDLYDVINELIHVSYFLQFNHLYSVRMYYWAMQVIIY